MDKVTSLIEKLEKLTGKKVTLAEDITTVENKRYAVDMDMYIYALDDEAAKQQAEMIAKNLNDEFDGYQAKIKGISAIPFGSIKPRKIV